MTHRPSGTMCSACEYRRLPACGRLPFAEMPIMRRDKDGTAVVRCVEFKRATPEAQQESK